jgi:ribosomal protein S18 acetylase RimI-like enzyme
MAAARPISRTEAAGVDALMLSVIGPDGARIAGASACLGICHCHGFLYPDLPLVVNSVKVAVPYRRRGIATAMYCEIEAVMRRQLHPSAGQRSGGERLWGQPNRPFGLADATRRQP